MDGSRAFARSSLTRCSCDNTKTTSVDPRRRADGEFNHLGVRATHFAVHELQNGADLVADVLELLSGWGGSLSLSRRREGSVAMHRRVKTQNFDFSLTMH